MKNIAVLGSTGSIGTQTLDVVRANPERLCVKALATGHNITQLESQIREFHPQIAAVWDEKKAKESRICTADLPVKIVSGMEGLLEIAQMEEAEVLVTAIVGMIGIRPTIANNKSRKGYCTCKQRDTCNCRSYHYASGKRIQRKDPSGGQRAQCDFPVLKREKRKHRSTKSC